MSKINICCNNCNNYFEKYSTDYNKAITVNPDAKFYCSMKCYNEKRKSQIIEKSPVFKNCVNCKKSFELESNGSGGHNRIYCYTCYPTGMNKSERDIFKRNLIRTASDNQKLSIGCKICGYKKEPTALEWHHHNDDKSYSPSDLLGKGSYKNWEIYQKEISKCVLLCSNCHREVHAGVSTIS